MAGQRSAEKLKRLVLAQSVSESLARSQVGEYLAEVNKLERQLSQARDAFTSNETTAVFSDLHLSHIYSLTNRCEQAKQRLEGAQRELQHESLRNKKLQSKLRLSQSHEQREEEQKMLLERLDQFSTRA